MSRCLVANVIVLVFSGFGWSLVPGSWCPPPESPILEMSTCRYLPPAQVLLLPPSCLAGDELLVSVLKQTVFLEVGVS